MSILDTLQKMRATGQKALSVLIDPDKITDLAEVRRIAQLVHESRTDFILVGGSLLTTDHFNLVIQEIRKSVTIPIILFPGSPSQISREADAILFLSLISGRNPELLIGQHVVAAPTLRQTNLEIIPTGYMLVDCGRPTTASYISQTFPIPWNKPEIAATTALAGEYLGLKCIYLDGGSGAEKPVSAEMIAQVRQTVQVPIIVGGGIRHEDQAKEIYAAGADMIVVGTAFEEEPELLFALAQSKTNW
ncbi:MAG: geranylgeranylglyceryl/heptaprenylglyceryl phosphate synthase [Flavobacteriales bacterium]|nr:geranylgeranylglyceryl/heptaprenylglyceryl phosphate synthase [Flavobacteriales bacterium]